jgi:NAD(P)H dehydrogenase (quinone)
MAKIAIIYYSSTGTTYQLAKAIQAGAEKAGAEAKFLKVKELAPQQAINANEKWKKHLEHTSNIPEATMDDLEWADGLIFGTPTRYGLPTSQLKQFLDQTGPLWSQGKLGNKVVSSFTSTATAHGGQESTILAINQTFYHWGCIIIGLGYLESTQFESGNPYGASFTSNNGQLDPDEKALTAARLQGKRMAEITARFHH